MSKDAAILSKHIRSKMGWSQTELAEQLLVSRNYISLIEGGRKEASLRLLAAIMTLARDVEKVRIIDDSVAALGVQEDGPRISVSSADEARLFLDTTITAANGNPSRLNWILEQLHVHLTPPLHWANQDAIPPRPGELSQMHAKILKKQLLEERRSRQKGKGKAASDHSPPSTQAGAGR